MDGNEKFWTGIIALIVAGIVMVAITTSFYYQKQDARVVEMVRLGADPTAAYCAMQDTLHSSPSCVIYATRSVLTGE